MLNLLQDLQDELGLTYMFVTHDLSVVRHISDDICVMYLGQVVETCPSKELFEQSAASLHPGADLGHSPRRISTSEKKRIILEGEIMSPIDPKPGCRFAARCIYAKPECHEPQEPEELLPGHSVLCWRAKELNGL